MLLHNLSNHDEDYFCCHVLRTTGYKVGIINAIEITVHPHL